MFILPSSYSSHHCSLLRKSHIRGALTTGFQWCFIALDLNDNGDGATYSISELLEWKCPVTVDPEGVRAPRVEPTSDMYDPALIAGILSTWVRLLQYALFLENILLTSVSGRSDPQKL